MEQSSWGFEEPLLATSPGHDFGASNDLVATGAALAGRKCDSVGNYRRATSHAAGADGLAGLQALAR